MAVKAPRRVGCGACPALYGPGCVLRNVVTTLKPLPPGMGGVADSVAERAVLNSEMGRSGELLVAYEWACRVIRGRMGLRVLPRENRLN